MFLAMLVTLPLANVCICLAFKIFMINLFLKVTFCVFMVSKNEVIIGMKNYQLIKPVCVFIDLHTHNKNVYSTYAVEYKKQQHYFHVPCRFSKV